MTNMKIFLIAMILLPGFVSCIKEKSTVSNTVFANTTPYAIQVNAYTGGQVQPGSTFSLAANETKQVFSIRDGGIGNGTTFGYIHFPVDSFVVVFDTAHSIAHYKPALTGNNPKRYLYSSKRNIYNDSSYAVNILSDTKYKREWGFKYTFTEQDYLDAR
jgi:hypothetical protein